MSTPRFLQFHYLTAYPASLLNRDDAGFAKRVPFGGAVRTRVSSQCLKRHWRTHQGPHALSEIRGPESMSLRSRHIFSERIAGPLKEQMGLDSEWADAAVSTLMNMVLGKSKGSDAKEKKGLRTNQIVVLGYPEVLYLRQLLSELSNEERPELKKLEGALKDRIGKEGLKNLRAVGKGAGLDAALFGRMKTSDLLADCDASVYVAHAFTVHAEQSETDYFTAVDDLLKEAEGETGMGAGHVNEAELTSGLYYGYAAVDLPLLVSNLEGCHVHDWEQADRSLAGEVVEHFTHLLATVSPGAKLGATAPFSYAHFLAVECGDAQPCTWANAFFKPVFTGPDLVGETLNRLDDHVGRIDTVYEPGNERQYVSLEEIALRGADRVSALNSLAAWAANRVRGAS